MRSLPRSREDALTVPARRRLVLVSGPPGAGKTTLAAPLAAELGFGLLAKDMIKETLHDWLGQQADLAWSRRLGAASMELLWALAAASPAVVLEANFYPDDPRIGGRIRALATEPVEVFCHCPEQESARRYRERAPDRHRVHADSDPGRTFASGFARSARPIGVGALVTVDTSRPVDVAAVARRVRQLLPAGA